MTKQSPSDSEKQTVKGLLLTRRGFLKAGAAGATLIAIEASGCAPAATPSQTKRAQGTPAATAVSPSPTIRPVAVAEVYLFFNQAEAATIKAVFGRLLPGNPQDPGAIEAGAHVYIDHALAGPYAAQQTLYRRGIASIDSYGRSKYNKNFVDLSSDQQDSLLTDMQSDKAAGFYAPGAAAFFKTLLQHLREGTFCDPAYGGNQNLVGWKLVGFPGAQLAYGDDDMKPGADQARKNSLTLADTESIPMPGPQSGF